MRPVPIIPTVLVAAAVAIMIALGFWQLGRSDEKAEMIARYTNAQTLSAEVPFPRSEADVPGALYRRSQVTCERVLSTRSTASRDPNGTSGLAQVALCALAGGGETEIMLGWTQRPQIVDWKGGTVTGWVAPAGDGARLVASPPTFGLAQLPAPDPRELPNNHLAYAGQWFFFALTAFIIYALVLRRRWRERD